jgi:pyruvate/2-oxoglutarate dehydrogenase complex dihydrolipoamide acyltransferase (E2) component
VYTQVTVEIRSPFAGRIVETFSEVGDEINVGEPLYVLVPLQEGEGVAGTFLLFICGY